MGQGMEEMASTMTWDPGGGRVQRLQWEAPRRHPRAGGAMSGKLRIVEGLGNTGLGVHRNRPGERQRGKGRAAESPQKAQHGRQTEAEPPSRIRKVCVKGDVAGPHWCRQCSTSAGEDRGYSGRTFRSQDQHHRGREGVTWCAGPGLGGAVSDPASGKPCRPGTWALLACL